MKDLSFATSIQAPARPATACTCPLNEGVAILDQMLATVLREAHAAAQGPTTEVATDADALLDFRLLLEHTTDAAAVLREFFRLRSLLGERHYLPCYRLRRWLETQFVARVQIDRTRPPRQIGLRLDGLSFDELCARCGALAADGAPLHLPPRVCFTLA